MPLSTASASGLPRRFLGFERTGQLLEERSRSGVGAGRRGDEEPKRRTFLEQRQSFQPRIIRGEKARQDRSPQGPPRRHHAAPRIGRTRPRSVPPRERAATSAMTRVAATLPRRRSSRCLRSLRPAFGKPPPPAPRGDARAASDAARRPRFRPRVPRAPSSAKDGALCTRSFFYIGRNPARLFRIPAGFSY
jgi:hypothetical protein